MLLLEFADVAAILFLWIIVPVISIRLIATFRAAVPRWVLRVNQSVQRALLVFIIIGVPIIALYLFVFLADKGAVRRGMRGNGEHAPPHIVRHLRRAATDAVAGREK
jgi:hypothetical protein